MQQKTNEDQELLEWDVYEISSDTEILHGVRLRGRMRKFCIANKINIIVENASYQDTGNAVRFAVLSGTCISPIRNFVDNIFPSSEILILLERVQNPVISRLQINNEERYEV